MYLTRIRPDANMRRFYSLEIMPDLFGGVVLVRNWGRIGTSGSEHRSWFASPREAEAECEYWSGLKTRRGYAPSGG